MQGALMAILSLSIYGSRSRGDHSESSDVDLFAITNEKYYKMVVNGITNIACYPKSLAVQRAGEGDLFMLHLCEEAKELYHSDYSLSQLKDEFRYKNSYSHEITCASHLAWYLIDFNSGVRNALLINKRIAWCVRTILIAKSAETRNPVFSTNGLVEYSGMQNVYNLIDLKDSHEFNLNSVTLLKDFLKSNGLKRPSVTIKSTKSYQDLFLMTNNIMGIKTLEAIDRDGSLCGYI